MKTLTELYAKQCQLYQYHNILVSYFSFVMNDKRKFRIYFTDLNKGKLYNPLIDGTYHSEDTMEEALQYIINEAEKYLNQPV